jgi:ribosomal protein L12E/L44/L45/RPP1/RPP2
MEEDKVNIEMDGAEIFALQEFLDSKNIDKFISKGIDRNTGEIASNALHEICHEFINGENSDEITNFANLFYSIEIELTEIQISEVLRFIKKVSIDDVRSWGFKIRVSKEITNAFWCIKDGLNRYIYKNSTRQDK